MTREDIVKKYPNTFDDAVECINDFQEPRYNSSMKTATLNNNQWVEVLELDSLRGLAYVMDEDGGEFQVSVNQLDNIEESSELPSQRHDW